MSIKQTFYSLIILSLLICLSGLTLYYSWVYYYINRAIFWCAMSGMIGLFILNANKIVGFTEHKFYLYHLKAVFGVCCINGIFYILSRFALLDGLELIITSVYLLLLNLNALLRYSEYKSIAR